MKNVLKFLNIQYLASSIFALSIFASKIVKKKIRINKSLKGLYGILQNSLATNRKTFPKSGLAFHLFYHKTEHKPELLTVTEKARHPFRESVLGTQGLKKG